MKFKVGDKVRLTREGLIKKVQNRQSIYDYEIEGFEISEMNGDRVLFPFTDYYESDLELVREEPEFEEGEMVEVSIDGELWEERIFLFKLPKYSLYPYITVCREDAVEYRSNMNYGIATYRYARKLRPSLTRKEIAKKLGVSEDFILKD